MHLGFLPPKMHAPPPPPPYVMLSDTYGNGGSGGGGGIPPPPPYRRNVPHYYSQPKRGKSFCFRCLCCVYCFLFLLVIILACLTFYFYSVYKPQMPTYKVQSLEVKAFDVQPDFSLRTEFLVTVKADNPNKGIGFIYGHHSYVIVVYNDAALCSGKLPSFRQGNHNTTMMHIPLTGKSEFGSGLQEALTENRHKGRIPLLVRVKVPVRVVVGEFPMRQFIVFVNCSLVVDNLSPNKKVGIVSSTYNVGFAF